MQGVTSTERGHCDLRSGSTQSHRAAPDHLVVNLGSWRKHDNF